jgi:hypothetical protein
MKVRRFLLLENQQIQTSEAHMTRNYYFKQIKSSVSVAVSLLLMFDRGETPESIE